MPELSLTTLTVINALLCAGYLPFGFMGWAFAAGGLANSPKDTTWAQRGVLALALAPGIVLLAATLAPWRLPEPWSQRVAWLPLGALALLIALVMVAALVGGFMQGIREGRQQD